MAVLALAALPYVAGALSDLAFVPGLFVAFPLAIGAVLVRARGKAQLVVVVAVGALPLVWAFQYLGGAGPQWGGRYILTSGVLLGVVATVRLRDDLPVVARGLTVLSSGSPRSQWSGWGSGPAPWSASSTTWSPSMRT